MLCPVCHRGGVMEVEMHLGTRRVVMHSCGGCENRWWDDDEGNPVALETVLALAGGLGRRRRR